ncbi:hypothetical protein [Limosilactobacillus vaginalis]|uniref:hypothetical protein n=1 Tax=Limosilactobacillus vaginalis TaxID=1633 RepID=UPI0024BA5026|nr:hypothetical protein [Limosilactobacillus vaginalis]
MNNIITFLNQGVKSTLNSMALALLSCHEIKDDNGQVAGYRAEVLPLSDSSRYVKRDGEIVDGPNALHSFNVIVNSTDIPENKGMIQGIKLINPRFVSAFATSQLNGTFATIGTTLVCDNIVLPNTQQPKRGDR